VIDRETMFHKEDRNMWKHRLDWRETATEIRLTEEPTLCGLVIRERGELIEFVSFAQARQRQAAAMRMAERVPEKGRLRAQSRFPGLNPEYRTLNVTELSDQTQWPEVIGHR